MVSCGRSARICVDQRCEGGLEDQHRAVEEVEQLAVLRRLVARVDRAPDGAGAADPEDAGERDRVVGRQDRHLVAGATPHGRQGGGDPDASAPAPRRTSASTPSVVRQGASGSEGRALVEVVDQPHRPQPSTVRTGSDTRPKLRSTPSSSRWPKAWHPEAKPDPPRWLLQQGVRRVGLEQAGLLVVLVAVDDAVRPPERTRGVHRVERLVEPRVLARAASAFITWAAVAVERGVLLVRVHVLGRLDGAGDDLRHARHQRLVEDPAEGLDVGHARVAAVPDRVRRAAPRQGQRQLVLAGDGQLVVARPRGPRADVGVLLEVVRPRQRGVDEDGQGRGDRSGCRPRRPRCRGCRDRASRGATSAAISPVVYICAMPGASSSPAAAKSAPYCSSQVISQSCSPVVSM